MVWSLENRVTLKHEISNTFKLNIQIGTPEGKVEKVQSLKNEGMRIAFVGDGVNDAPVVALADAGIAMGGLGSDVALLAILNAIRIQNKSV